MKKLLLFFTLGTLLSCSCLPQIPPQYLQANASCEAYLPDYTEYVSVINACGDAPLIQDPIPGTILDVTTPAVEVTLTAINSFGNTDIERFDVYLSAYPEIIWDSIPADTIPIVNRNDIDLMFDAVDTYRAYLGINDTARVLKIYR